MLLTALKYSRSGRGEPVSEEFLETEGAGCFRRLTKTTPTQQQRSRQVDGGFHKSSFPEGLAFLM